MSATFRQIDYDSVSEVFEMKNVAIMQGPLARRSTKFDFLVEGDPSKSMTKSAQVHLTNHPDSLEKAPWHLEVSATKKTNVTSCEESAFNTHFDVSH